MLTQDAATPATAIARHFYRLAPLGLSKHAQLRQSIIHAVDEGELQFQDKLPPERELGDILSLSLGTTQKALGSLAAEGYLIRKHGIGTFIGRSRRAIQKSWHYRFTNVHTNEHLPVYAHLLQRSRVGNGPWTPVLGPDPAGYIRIDRSISIDERYTCFSQLYLSATLFGRLLEIPASQLEDVNLKQVLEAEFGYPTVEAKGGARLVQPDSLIAALLGLPSGGWALKINIHARTHNQLPISYQKMYVPPTPDCELDMDFIGSS